MKTFAQALDLKDDAATIAEYEEYHRAVWPEVKAALRAVGIADMQIYRTGNRLFMTYTAPDDFDPDKDFASYTKVAKAREWDELMRGYQQRVPSAPEGAWWTPMPKVFDLGW
jgi:L-rhamnose mutarotase